MNNPEASLEVSSRTMKADHHVTYYISSHIKMFIFHKYKDKTLDGETIGVFGIDPEESLEEFF